MESGEDSIMGLKKDIAHRYPPTDGITAETTSQQGHTMNLLPQGINGKYSNVAKRLRKGFD